MDSMVVSRQWASRKDDERFLDIKSLKDSVEMRRRDGIEHLSTNKRFRATVTENEEDGGITQGLMIETEIGNYSPTNWSFHQIVNMAQKDVNWIRPSGLAKIHPEMAASAINYGLNFLTENENNKILVDTGRGDLRCVTGPDYGRIWDAEVVRAVEKATDSGRWQVPCATDGSHSKRSTTLYASDRDVFMFMVDPVNAIEVYNPAADRMEKKYRGFYAWNSEVGKATFGLATMLYDTICDNRIIWGMSDFREVRVRHTRSAPLRFQDVGHRMLKAYADSSPVTVQNQINKAMELEVANSEENAAIWLRRNGFGPSEAKNTVKMAKSESGEYKTLWSLVSGATAHARSITHQDTRVHMERRAGALMNKAA